MITQTASREFQSAIVNNHAEHPDGIKESASFEIVALFTRLYGEGNTPGNFKTSRFLGSVKSFLYSLNSKGQNNFRIVGRITM